MSKRKKNEKMKVQLHFVDDESKMGPPSFIGMLKCLLFYRKLEKTMSPTQKMIWNKVSAIVSAKSPKESIDGYVNWVKTCPEEVNILLDWASNNVDFSVTDDNGNIEE